MIREWNDGSTDSKYHGRMDLTVCVGGTISGSLLLQVIRRHCQHDCLFLQCVNILHHTSDH